MIPLYGSQVEVIKEYNDGNRIFHIGMIGIIESRQIDALGNINIRFTKRKANELFYQNNYSAGWNHYYIPLSVLLELKPDWEKELSL